MQPEDKISDNIGKCSMPSAKKKKSMYLGAQCHAMCTWRRRRRRRGQDNDLHLQIMRKWVVRHMSIAFLTCTLICRMMLGEYSSATEFLADTWWWSSCISEWCHESGLLVRCGGKHKWQGKLLSPNAKLWIPNPVTFVRIWKAICCQCTGNRMTAGGCSWSAHSKVSDEGFAYVCGGAVWWVYMANAERSLKEACDTTVH